MPRAGAVRRPKRRRKGLEWLEWSMSREQTPKLKECKMGLRFRVSGLGGDTVNKFVSMVSLKFQPGRIGA